MNETVGKTRIILADDHRMIRDGLRASFAPCADMEVVGEGDTDPVWVRAAISQADVVIVGVSKTPGNPTAILEYVIREWPQTRVIGLATVPNRVHMAELFRAGLHGYVTIECGFAELRAAVRTVMSGGTYLCSQAARTLLDDCAWSGSGGESPPDALLTDREATILQLLAEGRTSKEIGALLDLSSKTIDACRRQLMRKLHVDSMAGLVKCALLMDMTTAAPLAVK